MSNIVAEIQKDHIISGVRKDECSCPIALAIQEEVEASLPDNIDVEIVVSVNQDEINVMYFDDNNEIVVDYLLRPVASEDWGMINSFIEDFDAGNDVSTFNVELETYIGGSR
tara:strand:+ start:131 stop:466 length:336 start_codon:yes stop_codon:yes gene_type:complete